VQSLEGNSGGNETFFGRVGSLGALKSLTTDADATVGQRGGQAIFDVAGAATGTPTVTTKGGVGNNGQVYNDAVQLNQNTALADTASGKIILIAR